MSTFKRKKVVMLPTNEKAKIFYLTAKGREFNDLRYSDTLMPIILDSQNFNILILSDEEIKDGDFFVKMRNVPALYQERKVAFLNSEWLNSNDKTDCFKVIASTDPSMNLPSPSVSFIKKYILEYNKGNIISDVLVEYLQARSYDNDGLITDEYLNINPKNNSITISKMKDIFTLEELKTYVKDAIMYPERYVTGICFDDKKFYECVYE